MTTIMMMMMMMMMIYLDDVCSDYAHGDARNDVICGSLQKSGDPSGGKSDAHLN